MGDRPKKRDSFPINKSNFRLAYPDLDWSTGEELDHLTTGKGFASGVIELGNGLQVRQISNFERIWHTEKGGPGDCGVSFFQPHVTPNGFRMLGCYCQPNSRPLHGWVLAGKDLSGEILTEPLDYCLILSIKNGSQLGCIWEPIAQPGFKPVGYVVTGSPKKPPLDKIVCVRTDFTEKCELDEWLCGSNVSSLGYCYSEYGKWDIFGLKPKLRGNGSKGVSVGSFAILIPGEDGDSIALSCLSNLSDSYSLPNATQIDLLMRSYAPVVHFHPDEAYHPSSIDWYLRQCSLISIEEGTRTEGAASNLPNHEGGRDCLWLECPEKESETKRGSLEETEVYVQLKAMLGGTFTDLVIWLFYPFNGPGRVTVLGKEIQFARTGQHTGDWEHMTLRISNFSGELWSVYFSQHSAGVWVRASEIEYEEGTNRVVAYSSLNGHAMFPRAGRYIQGYSKLGAVNHCAKSEHFVDCATKYRLVSAGHLVGHCEPEWVGYWGRWGPKVEYTMGRWVRKVENALPWKLGRFFRKLIFLPNEMLGEDAPRGPRTKDCWHGDERVRRPRPAR